MKNLEERATSRPSRLKEEESRVKNLEDKAEALLIENEDLRQELSREEYLLKELENGKHFINMISNIRKNSLSISFSSAVPPKVTTKFIPKTSSEQVESLRVSIWERMDDISNIRSDLSSNHVPISVCNYLEQCLKDTEV